jgi:dTDP-4-amino-4,6-dideoxygalactose transaminase
MLTVNDDRFISRAEIIWEKGTNRAAFHRGEVDKYGWVDVGSSFLPAEMIAAFLYAQLEAFDFIQKKRKQAWIKYFNLLKPLQEQGLISLPHIPDYASMNGNLFYFFTRSLNERTNMLDYLKAKGIHAVFHYLPLEQSVYFKDKHDGRLLPNTQRFSDCIVRLPFFVELKQREIDYVCKAVISFYNR